LVARPLNVLYATRGQRFSWQEKLFLSWLAPRGIVAASMASLFALRLADDGVPGAAYLETMTYAVIGTTVLVQGLSAPIVARVLGLRRAERGVWLFVGEPTLAVKLHRVLHQVGGRSLVISTQDLVEPTDDEDVEAVVADPLAPQQIRDPRIADVEAVVAMSGDPELDARICAAWAPVVGDSMCYRWSGDPTESNLLVDDLPHPAEVVAGMEAGSVAIDAVEAGPPVDHERFADDLVPVLALAKGRINAARGDERSGSEHFIVLRRPLSGLYGLIRDAQIIEDRAADFEAVVRDLLELAAHKNKDLDIEEAVVKVLERESDMPTAIGHSVAVPHLYDEGCAQSTGYLALVPHGLDIGAPDHELVKLVFLIVSPAGKAQEHLVSLSAIARLARNRALVDTLLRQRTRGRVLALLRERE
jgi:mannitol/fructose-specific phosphotransferase system IIA component (Ntr-type)